MTSKITKKQNNVDRKNGNIDRDSKRASSVECPAVNLFTRHCQTDQRLSHRHRGGLDLFHPYWRSRSSLQSSYSRYPFFSISLQFFISSTFTDLLHPFRLNNSRSEYSQHFVVVLGPSPLPLSPLQSFSASSLFFTDVLRFFNLFFPSPVVPVSSNQPWTVPSRHFVAHGLQPLPSLRSNRSSTFTVTSFHPVFNLHRHFVPSGLQPSPSLRSNRSSTFTVTSFHPVFNLHRHFVPTGLQPSPLLRSTSSNQHCPFSSLSSTVFKPAPSLLVS